MSEADRAEAICIIENAEGTPDASRVQEFWKWAEAWNASLGGHYPGG
jgi:hypothetical protein